MRASRVQVSPGWLLVAMFIVGVNLAGIRAALEPKWSWVPAAGAGRAGVSVGALPDGSVVRYVHPLNRARQGPIVVRRPSAIGLWRVWWPVAASAGISLAVLGAARLIARRRSAQSGGRASVKTIHAMVVIGLISFGLWLIRFDLRRITSGAIVLLLMLLASYRRASLVQDIGTGERPKSALSVIGIAGYSIAMLLAVGWIISVLFWDSLRGSRL